MYYFYTIKEIKEKFNVAPRTGDWRDLVEQKNINYISTQIKNGIYNPLYVHNNYIYDGRKRLHAAYENKVKYKIPVIIFNTYQQCMGAIIQCNIIKLRELVRFFTYHSNDEYLVDLLCSKFSISKPHLFKYIEYTPEIACKLFDYGLLTGDDIIAINHYANMYKLKPYNIYKKIFDMHVVGKSYKSYLTKIHERKL